MKQDVKNVLIVLWNFEFSFHFATMRRTSNPVIMVKEECNEYDGLSSRGVFILLMEKDSTKEKY